MVPGYNFRIKPLTRAPLFLEFFARLSKLPPSFSPDTTPAYSDIRYALLAYALEAQANKTLEEMMTESIIKPLNLNHTFYSTPNDSLGIIPGNRWTVSWAFDMGLESP
jgi:CubicO group peptidase (beta-lactamase class C family)